MRMHTRKPCPSERKIRIKLHCTLIRIDGCLCCSVEEGATCFKSQPAQIRIVSLRIVCRFSCQSLLLATAELRLQRLRDSLGDLALNRKDVSQLPIIGLSPEVGIGLRVNQLNIDPHLIGHFFDATLKNIVYPKMPCDLGEVGRLALIPLRGSARNYL